MPLRYRISLAVLAILAGLVFVTGVQYPVTLDKSPGFHSCRWIDDSGITHRYVLFVPYCLKDNEQPPLILFLNGFGQDGSDGFQQSRANFGPAIWEKRSTFPFLAVFPQCTARDSWLNSNNRQLNKALSILDEVAKQFSVDDDRIFLTGPSSGGSGVWHVAASNPDRFTAIVPMCGYSTKEAISNIAESGLPVWNLCCVEDKPDLVNHNHELMQLLRDRGRSPLYTETATPSFYHDCWSVGYRMPPIYEWLLNQRKSHNRKRGKFTPSNQKDDWTGWSNNLEQGWRVSSGTDEQHLIFSNCSNAIDNTWLHYTSPLKKVEIHFEYQGNGSSSLTIGLLSKTDSGRNAQIKICPPHLGDGGLYISKPKKWIKSLDPIAQSNFQYKEWNDIRVSIDKDTIQIFLNGWAILEAPCVQYLPDEFDFALRVESSEEGQSFIRRIRLR